MNKPALINALAPIKGKVEEVKGIQRYRLKGS